MIGGLVSMPWRIHPNSMYLFLTLLGCLSMPRFVKIIHDSKVMLTEIAILSTVLEKWGSHVSGMSVHSIKCLGSQELSVHFVKYLGFQEYMSQT